MILHTLITGPLGVNCYILESSGKNALVIDAGADAEKIQAVLEENGLTLRMLAFTHGHFDHIGGADALASPGAEVLVPELDEEFFRDPVGTQGDFFPKGILQKFKPPRITRLYREGDEIQLDEIRLTVLHTPGHTPGSSLFQGHGMLFTGDTLFAGAAGRTDLYGGDSRAQRESMKRIASLEGDDRIFPGHGESSSLSREKQTNLYLMEEFPIW